MVFFIQSRPGESGSRCTSFFINIIGEESAGLNSRLLTSARFLKDHVHFGCLDFESTAPFRKTCLERLLAEPVVFDLKNLNFVGSLGLTDFVDTLDHMARQSRRGVKFCGLSSEFLPRQSSVRPPTLACPICESRRSSSASKPRPCRAPVSSTSSVANNGPPRPVEPSFLFPPPAPPVPPKPS